MKLENITVNAHRINGFCHVCNEGVHHVKELPYLSVVQATEGYYSFGLGDAPMQDLPEGGCFVAPSFVTQSIVHHVNPRTGTMSARWIFLDVTVNDGIPFDSVFSLPIYPDEETCRAIGAIFDRLFDTEDLLAQKIGCYELLQLLMPMAGRTETVNAHVSAAMAYMKEHQREGLSVDRIAKAVGLSASRLHRLFHDTLHVSPIAYLNDLRLSHACYLLECSDLPVARVAEVCGIGDAFYFSKMFRKKYGISPLQYRKRAY